MRKIVVYTCALAFVVLGGLPIESVAVDCKSGFVLRLATTNDEVCVSPATRARTVSENIRASMLWTPGPFGPKTCVQGYVWRQASEDDRVCVVPSTRAETLHDNALAPTRRD